MPSRKRFGEGPANRSTRVLFFLHVRRNLYRYHVRRPSAPYIGLSAPALLIETSGWRT